MHIALQHNELMMIYTRISRIRMPLPASELTRAVYLKVRHREDRSWLGNLDYSLTTVSRPLVIHPSYPTDQSRVVSKLLYVVVGFLLHLLHIRLADRLGKVGAQ